MKMEEQQQTFDDHVVTGVKTVQTVVEKNDNAMNNLEGEPSKKLNQEGTGEVPLPPLHPSIVRPYVTASSTDFTFDSEQRCLDPITPRRLRKGIVPDSGTVPLWLNDTLKNKNDKTRRGITHRTKTFRHPLSGERKSDCCSDMNNNQCNQRPPLSPAQSRSTISSNVCPITPKVKTSALANAFLDKVRQSLTRDVEKARRKAPSLRPVKSIKGRWPPKTNVIEHSPGTGCGPNTPSSKMKKREFKLSPSVSTKELKVAFETGNFRQTTSLSPHAIREAASKRARMALMSPVSVRQRQESIEWKATSKRNNLTIKQKEEHKEPSSPAPSEWDGDNSTLSSHDTPENVRCSYKIQYLGGGKWNDGMVDASFPSMVLRCLDSSDDRFDAENCDEGLPIIHQRRLNDSPVEYKPTDRFSSNNQNAMAPGLPHTDRRFDSPSPTGCLPPMPSRSGDTYIPIVWQTRVSNGKGGDATKRKWRLKRVWENYKDKSIVIEDVEPDYLVDESDLESALDSLLGVPDRYSNHTYNTSLGTATTEMESNAPCPTKADLVQSRWDANNDDKAPLMKKPYRIQRVWDTAGEVCQIDDEESICGLDLLEVFGMDQHMPVDSLVMDYSKDSLAFFLFDSPREKVNSLEPAKEVSEKGEVLSLSLPLTNDGQEGASEAIENTAQNNVDHQQECDNDSFVSLVSEDDDASYVEDGPLDDDEFTASLGSFEKPQSNRSLHLVRRKLRKVERMINDMVQENGAKAKDKKLYRRLQEKCMQYLNELSEYLAEFDEDEARELDNDKSMNVLERLPYELFGIDETEEESGSDYCDDETRSRDPAVVERKLQKTEKLLNRMVADRGDQVKRNKLYRRLEEKRAGYLEELGMQYEPLEIISECQTDRTASDAYSFSDLSTTTSLHSMLNNLTCLDIIFEEDNASRCSMDEEHRDRTLLRRKIRKCEKMMQKLVAKKGPRAKRRKLYRRLEQKLFQYHSELGKNSCLSPSKNKGLNNLRERVVSAMDIIKLNMDESIINEEELESVSDIEVKSTYPMRFATFPQTTSKGKGNTPHLACNNVGKWTSPLETAQPNGESKLFFHTLESVYM